jgi:hypothetical protein
MKTAGFAFLNAGPKKSVAAMTSQPGSETQSLASSVQLDVKEDAQEPDASATSTSPKDYDPSVIEQADALVDGVDLSSVDPSLYAEIHRYLRERKLEVHRSHPPDYLRAQRMEDLCGQLLVLVDQGTYCTYKSYEADRLQEKINHARAELQAVLDERERALSLFNDQREKAAARLQQQHDSELARRDDYYAGELPAKWRHVSGEVLQIREQERFLRQSRRYVEAQRMMEEADALEAFEIERQKVRWYNEGVGIRETMVARHAKQMSCLQERFDRTWSAMVPDSLARERQWNTVIQHLEAQLRREREESAEAGVTARSIVRRDPGLPTLRPTGAPNPMRRVTTVNNQRAYTMYAPKRARSSTR